LEISVEGIGEVQVTVPGVDTDVVEGVELATEVVVEKGWLRLAQRIVLLGILVTYWWCCKEGEGS
jgi:hypothetical protein